MSKIAVIVGSLRRESINRKLAEALAKLAGPKLEFVFIKIDDLPLFNQDLEASPPAAVTRIKGQIDGADGVLIVTPEYNRSIPGVLKNALDWASRPVADNVLRGKPAAVIGASTGLFGAVWAQAEVRKVLGAIGAEVVDRELPVMQAHAQFDEYGNLREEELRNQLAEHVTALVRATREKVPTA